MKPSAATPYAATIILFRKEGKIAFLLRHNTAWMDGYYSLPGGKVEQGENFIQAAIREAKEEVGVAILPQNMQHLLTLHRYNSDEGAWVDVIFEATAWKGELINAEPHKHSKLIWIDPQNLPKNTIPATVFYLKSIQDGATYAEYGWTS